MDDDEASGWRVFHFYSDQGAAPLSAAGRMLQHMNEAERRLTLEGVNDELRAALRRVQITSTQPGT